MPWEPLESTAPSDDERARRAGQATMRFLGDTLPGLPGNMLWSARQTVEMAKRAYNFPLDAADRIMARGNQPASNPMAGTGDLEGSDFGRDVVIAGPGTMIPGVVGAGGGLVPGLGSAGGKLPNTEGLVTWAKTQEGYVATFQKYMDELLTLRQKEVDPSLKTFFAAAGEPKDPGRMARVMMDEDKVMKLLRGQTPRDLTAAAEAAAAYEIWATKNPGHTTLGSGGSVTRPPSRPVAANEGRGPGRQIGYHSQRELEELAARDAQRHMNATAEGSTGAGFGPAMEAAERTVQTRVANMVKPEIDYLMRLAAKNDHSVSPGVMANKMNTHFNVKLFDAATIKAAMQQHGIKTASERAAMKAAQEAHEVPKPWVEAVEELPRATAKPAPQNAAPIAVDDITAVAREMGLATEIDVRSGGTTYIKVYDPALGPKKSLEVRVPPSNDPHGGRVIPWRIDTSVEGTRNPIVGKLNIAGEPYQGNIEAVRERIAHTFGKQPKAAPRDAAAPSPREGADFHPDQPKLLSGGVPAAPFVGYIPPDEIPVPLVEPSSGTIPERDLRGIPRIAPPDDGIRRPLNDEVDYNLDFYENQERRRKDKPIDVHPPARGNRIADRAWEQFWGEWGMSDGGDGRMNLGMGGARPFGDTGAPLAQKTVFVGEKSGGINKGAIAEAEEMARGKADVNEIWEATGLFKADDGKWIREVSDAKAEFVAPPTGTKGTALGKILKHPELYKIAPEIANMPVIIGLPFVPRMLGATGAYQKGSLAGPAHIILAEKELDNPDRAIFTLLHELQHALQDKDGRLSIVSKLLSSYAKNPQEREAQEVEGRSIYSEESNRRSAPYSTAKQRAEHQRKKSRQLEKQ